MKTTIFTLFFLSSVCFFPQLGNINISSLSFETKILAQDTTTLEFWKNEATKWKAIAKQNSLEALQNMTFAQRQEHEAKLQRKIAEANAQEAIEQSNLAGKMAEDARQQHNKAEDWKFLYYNLAEAFLEIDSVFKDFAKQAYEDEKHLKAKIAELEKLFEERKKLIEELKE